MPTRISTWFRSFIRKLKRKWWLWIGMIVSELSKDRLTELTNNFIGKHVGWVLPALSVIKRSPVGIVAAAFLGTVLVLLVLAFVETLPKTKPQLSIPAGGWRSGGLYDVIPNLIGWELAVTNSEARFHTIANNVRARITLRHILGNTVSAGLPWLIYENPRKVADYISIDMGETARLLVLVARNDVLGRFLAGLPWPPITDEKHRLEFGQWNVEIALSGDNVGPTIFEGILTLNANGEATLKLDV